MSGLMPAGWFGVVVVLLAACEAVTAWALEASQPLPRIEDGGRVVVLDDFQQGNLDAWEGSARVELGPGEKDGDRVLVWRCTDVESSLEFKPLGRIPDLAKYTRVRMHVRASSDRGPSGPFVAARTDLLFGGLPWQIGDLPPIWHLWDRRPVQGDSWRRLDLWTDFPDWYDFTAPGDNSRPRFVLRSSALFGQAATVMIDDIRLIADVVEVLGKETGGVWGEGRRLPNGDFRYEYPLRVRNLTDRPQHVRATADARMLRAFTGGLRDDGVAVPPRETATLTAFVDIPAARIADLPDLYHEELLVTVEADGAPGTDQLVPLLATKPLGKVPHPCILHPAEWWAAERARFAALAPEARTQALAEATALLGRDAAFPATPTVRQGRRLNDGSTYERPGWSEADGKVFTANFAAIRKLGEAWQRTRDERFAAKAAAMMLDLARKYPGYPLRATVGREAGNARIAINNLHEGYWIADLAGAYDLILDSPAPSAEDRETIRRDLLLTAARGETTNCSGFNNQTSTRYTAGALFGLLADDANLVQHAVYGHHGLAMAADVSISADGFLTELPANYHWANLKEMLALPIVCRNAGLKIDVATARIRLACDAPYLRAMPNLGAPAFGACGYGFGVGDFGMGNYPRAAELFGDERYRRLADPAQARGLVDTLPSTAFEEGGMVVLRERDRTGPDRTYMAILSTNVRRAANQSLHFVLYSDGAVLCPSPGTLYNAGGDARWVSPWSSTILVDRKPQRGSIGRIVAHDFRGPAQMALLDAGNVSEGVGLQRAVALAHGMVFVVDRASSAEKHAYERVQMVCQEIARPPSETTDLELSEGEHIRFRGTRLDGDWGMAWRIPQGPGLEFGMAGEPGTEVFWGDNQVNGFKPQMFAPTVVTRRVAENTVFLNVMEPFRDRPSRLRSVRRVKVHAGPREATDAEAVAVAAITDTDRVVFVVNYDGSPKTCAGRPVTAALAVFTEPAGDGRSRPADRASPPADD